MEKRKAFTLVELLAVIVILGIILAIAVPTITNIVNNTKISAIESDAKLLLKAALNKLTTDQSLQVGDINETTVSGLLGVSSSNYETLTIKELNNALYVTIVGKGKWVGLTASGTKTGIKVDDTVTSFSKGANKPVLAPGMTAIKRSGSSWVNVSNPESDTSWYNYTAGDKMWANATTEDGSYWVWIPRYIYKITANWNSSSTGTIEVQFTKGVDDNWNKDVIGYINLEGTAETSNNKWTNHPGFTFGDRELTGFWVAKFEPTAAEGLASSTSTCNAADNVNNKTVKIIPGVQSWRCINVKNAFESSRAMETNSIYGWGETGEGIDTHVMKNSEWGAVAYLAKSSYGKTTEITINNNTDYYTGGGTGEAYITNVAQSTTGNVYGIYDISGGAYDITMANYNNTGASSGWTNTQVAAIESKYIDRYYTEPASLLNGVGFAYDTTKYGDAVYETSNNAARYNGSAWSGSTSGSWYSDLSYIPTSGHPWFPRGGHYSHGSFAGAFAFTSTTGGAGAHISFRLVVLVGSGL